MRFTKPTWVTHKDSSARDGQGNYKPLSIFSVHVHPDGSRIATGGLDAKVRIWSTKPILNPASEESGRPPKSLCTLTMHTGPVLTVRWAHSGRWLASGSDDTVVMIWDLDPTAKGKVWGSDEVIVEGWKPLKRLPGHESDVTDVAWSPGDRYLASVGLDSKVFIWCGYTLERLQKLENHQGFVKGVCWDPVGEFMATQSDDRSVIIWRTTDWGVEAEVKKPFADSPGSTFFRRLSWSPDGAHITASNATNNNGFVFIAAVITRGTWTSEISLVGHENTVEVAAYNPHIFLRDPLQPVATANICSVVALGADDRSISVWQTKSARPLIVAKDVFERQIMDLGWSWDGLTLYAVSSDGTLGAFSFTPEELVGIAPLSVQEKYLQKFSFRPPPLPEGFSHIGSNTETQPVPTTPVNVAPSNGEVINKLVAKRGKKRVTLQNPSASSIPSASMNFPPQANNPPSNGRSAADKSNTVPSVSNMTESASAAPSFRGGFTSTPISASHSRHRSASTDPFDVQEIDPYAVPMDYDIDVPISALGGLEAKSKSRDEAIGKARTLGGDQPRQPAPSVVKVISDSAYEAGPSRLAAPVTGRDILPSLPLLTFLSATVENSDSVFEARNSENYDSNEVTFVSSNSSKPQIQWLDYLPSPALAVTVTPTFCAVAMRDGSVNVYSHTGRKIMPPLTLGSPCNTLESSKTALVVITASGQLFSWDVKKQTSNFPPVSVHPILALSSDQRFSSVSIRPNGIPILHLSNGTAHTYDAALSCFTKLADRWYSEGSTFWQGRQRSTTTQTNGRGVLASIEAATIGNGEPPAGDTQRPTWWGAALSLGHLETRLFAARALDSPAEYKQALLVYARRIADEGFRAKAEELIRELFGPLYWKPPSGGKEESWSPTVLGMVKRDLLKEVLSIFARSKTLTKLAMDWQDLLKKAASVD